MLQHAIMQEILVDRRQLVFQGDVEEFDDLGITLHGDGSVADRDGPSAYAQQHALLSRAPGACRNSWTQAVSRSSAMMVLAKDRHCPHLGRRPKRAYAEDGLFAPDRTASRNYFSLMALQMHTSMFGDPPIATLS